MKTDTLKAFPPVLLLCTAFLCIGLLYVLGVGFEYSQHELSFRFHHFFFYIRRCVLLCAGVAGIVCLKGSVQNAVQWTLHNTSKTSAYAAIIVPYAAMVGYFSPRYTYESTGWVLLCMALLHAVSEESFFRGFLGGSIASCMPHSKALALVLSATCYGLYQWTYYEVVVAVLPYGKWHVFGMCAGFVALPLQWVCMRSQSLWPALLARCVMASVAVLKGH